MGNFNRGGGGGRSFGGGGGGFNRGGGSRGGFGGGRDGERPQMHRATCAECGDSCQVPFKPTGDKPVFCSECFGKQQDNGGGRSNDRGGRSNDRGGFSGDRRERRPREDREMHDVVCDECSKDCQVPFKPSPGKPILCDECFSKSRGKGRGGDNKEVMEQIKNLNEKMDKLISILDPNASKKVAKKVEKKEEKKETPASAKATVDKKKVAKKAPAKKTATKKVAKKKAPAKKKTTPASAKATVDKKKVAKKK